MLVYCFKPVRHSIVPSFCQSVIPSTFNVFFCNIRNVCRICSNFHNTITIRQCVFGGKTGTEGSVSQELCHFVIPPDINGYKPDKYRRCNARVPNKPYGNG